MFPVFKGIKAILAESYERIHRSNLIGMGIIPLQFLEGQTADTLNLTGTEEFDIDLTGMNLKPGQTVTISVADKGLTFHAKARFDTELELAYYRNGGILQYMVRKVLGNTVESR